MPLYVSTASLTHDLTLVIDDEPVQVHIKRLSKEEALAFHRQFVRFGMMRGTLKLTEEEDIQRETDAIAFVEGSIKAYVSFAPGCVTNDEGDVVTGEQIVATFQTRNDVLAALYQAIYSEHFLGKLQKNALSSSSTFYPGSVRPKLGQDGMKQESIASSAASSTTVGDGGAVESPAKGPSGKAIH